MFRDKSRISTLHWTLSPFTNSSDDLMLQKSFSSLTDVPASCRKHRTEGPGRVVQVTRGNQGCAVRHFDLRGFFLFRRLVNQQHGSRVRRHRLFSQTQGERRHRDEPWDGNTAQTRNLGICKQRKHRPMPASLSRVTVMRLMYDPRHESAAAPHFELSCGLHASVCHNTLRCGREPHQG